MSSYRVYQLDPAGRIAGAEWLEADSDGQAESAAKAFCTPGTPKVELWHGPRRIAVLDCDEARAR